MEASGDLNMVSDHQTPERAARLIAATDDVVERIAAILLQREDATIDTMSRMVRHLEIMLRDDWIIGVVGDETASAWRQYVDKGSDWMRERL